MGTLVKTGKNRIEKFLLGSVADKVIRNSGIPVLCKKIIPLRGFYQLVGCSKVVSDFGC